MRDLYQSDKKTAIITKAISKRQLNSKGKPKGNNID